MNLMPNAATGRIHDPVQRGYALLYRAKGENHCPGCGRSHWMVGRTMAECAFCGTALPMEAAWTGLSRYHDGVLSA